MYGVNESPVAGGWLSHGGRSTRGLCRAEGQSRGAMQD